MAQEPTKSISLYQGEVTIDFYEDRHCYIKRGEKGCLTSVTGATGMIDKSRPLIFWAIGLMRDHLSALAEQQTLITLDHILEASKLHQQKKEEAATKGSQVHAWIEQYINAKLNPENQKPEMPEDEQIVNGVIAFLNWEKDHNVKFVATEKIVYSKKHDYVGLMDCEAIIDGKRSVVDFKTSTGVYNEMRYQVAAYRAADEEETGKKYDGPNWIIRFDKDTAEFEPHEFNEQAKDFKAFLGALALKNREKELSKK